MGELSIGFEWGWRIEDATSIICGSLSEQRSWEPAFELIRSSNVVGLSVFGRLPEIDLSLTDNRHLVSFSIEEGQPEWSLTDRRSTPHLWLTVHEGVLLESDGTVPQD